MNNSITYQRPLTNSSSVVHAIHLLNDFSGSPLVFSEVIKNLVHKGKTVQLYTATPSGNGFLFDLKGIKTTPLFYRRSSHQWLTFLYFCFAQCWLFFQLLLRVKKNDVVYVNTLLPFVALLAGKLKGAHTIMHIHEVSLRPRAMKRTAVLFTEHFADEVIFVSHYLRTQYHFQKPQSRIEFNTLPTSFTSQAKQFHLKNQSMRRTILMICSLKTYKGVEEFIALSTQLPEYDFELVLNADSHEVHRWVDKQLIPNNCTLFASQSNTHPFYERARVVMNLSRPTEWIETFGMTILEAMAYHCHVIVPMVGGPVELIQNYPFGKAISGTNFTELKKHIQEIFADHS